MNTTSHHRRLILGLGIAALLSFCLWRITARAQQPAHPGASAPVFSHPTNVTNAYLPLARMHRMVLEGTDGGKSARIELTMKPGTRLFTVDGQKVAACVMEDRAYAGGKLIEIALDYFAQADDGTVYYLGEDVDIYRDGKVVGHGGSWLTGEHKARPGVMMPAHPKIGDKYKSEDVPGVAEESDEIVSVEETVSVPAGTYKHCVKVKEMVPGEDPEIKYYAPNIGVVREALHDGDVRLTSHK